MGELVDERRRETEKEREREREREKGESNKCAKIVSYTEYELSVITHSIRIFP